MTGLDLKEVCADLTTFVPGRRLDDSAQVMLRYAGGARGVLWASQVASGNETRSVCVPIPTKPAGIYEMMPPRDSWMMPPTVTE